MDAREYLNRKGVGQEREQDRPNTLEEKAWERARGSGDQRPKAGTPHDWEDWERFHADLAAGAKTLEQKIDKEAHRREASGRERSAPSIPSQASAGTPSSSDSSDVEHFDPKQQAAVEHSAPASSVSVAPAPTAPASVPAASERTRTGKDIAGGERLALYALAVVLPPLAVALAEGGGRRVAINLVLTLLGWVPGVMHAFFWLRR
ncbi:YqaE/Pmp3 family membrane protein [Halomonas dongshanensis]|uniref:YqaE/Pmp3 family membrane protein n=1 Tax=Halomonas dongshanensis TaxID=2890835 RepID=A0ABT2EFL6_9GAMM|nr:YqaE/Pmp3 family membrane protein [Halomonas dongshanensis]MCS2609905.1 YqaE/Pmp3 family membrane protein [Halomonas dongshanensis]